jgi:hypothetical protein
MAGEKRQGGICNDERMLERKERDQGRIVAEQDIIMCYHVSFVFSPIFPISFSFPVNIFLSFSCR